MADASCQDEEVEHRVHVLLLVDAVEHGTRDVAYSLGYDPPYRGGRHRVDQWLEGYEHRKPHAHEASRLQVAVVLEPYEAHHRTRYGAGPDEDEQAPSPVSLLAHGYERDGRIGTSYVPVDGGMVPFAQSLLPLAPGREGMVGGGGYIRHEHAEEVKDDACRGPSVVLAKAPIQEDGAKHDSQEDAAGMRPGVPQFFLMTEMYF